MINCVCLLIEFWWTFLFWNVTTQEERETYSIFSLSVFIFFWPNRGDKTLYCKHDHLTAQQGLLMMKLN